MNGLSSSEKMKRGAVLGLDVAKASVQAELRLPWSNGKVRFAFANEPSGFTKLEQVLAQHHCAKVHAGLEEPPVLTASNLPFGSMSKITALAYSIRAGSRTTRAAPERAIKAM